MERVRHPGITGLGYVRQDVWGRRSLSGWTLTRCLAQCSCHTNPTTRCIEIHEDNVRGRLGLRQFRDCNCCQPWTVAELLAVLDGFAQLNKMETTS